MAAQGPSDKAKKYLALLDEARCNDRWSEVPELARKVGKHAPERQCLVYTSRIESELASRSPSKTPSGTLGEPTITGLESAIDNETSNEEDISQARATLALALLSADAKERAIAVLPRSSLGGKPGQPRQRLQGWTYVSAIKIAYVRELCSTTSDEQKTRHQDLLSFIHDAPSNVRKSSAYCTWLVKLLSRICTVTARRPLWTPKTRDSAFVERMLAPFRAWYTYWEDNSDTISRHSSTAASEGGPTQREIWRSYYFALSDLLRSGYSYPSSTTHGPKGTTPRYSQSSELRKAEAVYESFLLKEVSFPEASTTNQEVDNWADQVMENWSLTCGSTWQDQDLGPGGREAASKQVLNILYRAATRSFHSCSILRHLFAVHASLGEFELASKALDSYLDIVLKGKSRVEKSGQPEAGLDSDEAMLQTMSYGIDMHCSFGKLEGAACALQLSKRLEDWLARHERSTLEISNSSSGNSAHHLKASVHPVIIAQVHRAIAVGKANWARFVLESAERTSLQNQATKHLRQSLITDEDSPDDPKTLYALALVLAETRDTEGAIATVKHALSAHSQLASDIGQDDLNVRDQQKITLAKMSVVQCWHLLALLLSSRQEHDKAEAACEAALESIDNQGSSHDFDIRQLTFFEKQHIIEVKMTQSMLLEISGGADLAITAGSEALRLYAYLFSFAPPSLDSQEPPKTADSTVKPGRGSLFGKKKQGVNSARVSTAPESVYSNRLSEDTTRPPTMAGGLPESSTLVPPGTTPINRSPSHKLQKRPSKRSVTRGRLSSPARPATATTMPIPSTVPHTNGVDEAKIEGNVDTNNLPGAFTEQLNGLTLSTLPAVTVEDIQWESKRQSPGTGHSHFLPYLPLPARLSPSKQERYTLGLLSKIWAFVSALYRRAGLFDDAHGAIDEAFKLANRAESHAATSGTASASQYEEQGWGGGKSVDETWADIHAESALLSVAEGSPYEAMSKFETALSYFPEHPTATIGLSTLLLDIYTQILPLQRESLSAPDGEENEEDCTKVESSQPILEKIDPIHPAREPPRRALSSVDTFPSLSLADSVITVEEIQKVVAASEPPSKPGGLDQLAARDRAFSLLSSLVKLGTSWDNSEAWFALARAYEESKQADKAKDVLWWVVELEDKKPVRRWDSLGQGYSC